MMSPPSLLMLVERRAPLVVLAARLRDARLKERLMRELRTCSKCGQKIPAGRLEALPETQTCLRCSDAAPKTAADVEVDGPDGEDMIHQQSRDNYS